MARRRIVQPKSPDAAGQPEASLQDEADISREMGAEEGPEGELVADENAVRKAGAVDTDSVRENRRMTRAVHNKRTGKNVQLNVDDVLVKYDQMLRLYAADTIYISVKRVSGGSPVQQTITSAPRNGAELYNALRAVHGRHEEASYAIYFFDPTNKAWRGKGQITMPDTRDTSPQGQPPMGYPPYGQPAAGYPPQPFPPQPQVPATPQAQAPDIGSVLNGFRQLMEMVQSYQSGTVQSPPSTPGDPVSTQIDQLRQMLDMVQHGRTPARGQAAAAVNPQMAAAMMGMGMPPVQPPQGTIWVPGFGFVALERLMQALNGGPAGGGGFGSRPYRGPFAAAAGNGGGGGGDDPPPPPYRGSAYASAQTSQAPQERTAAQAFRDSVSLIRTASDAARELQSLFPGQEAHEPVASVSIEDEDSPMRVIDAGGAKLVVNKKDGSLRTWETGFANMDKIFKWAGEQIELVRSREAQRPKQQLPPGVVEVHPGYQPPPGYAAVPLHPGTGEPQFEQALPPPPSNIPPPLGGSAQPRIPVTRPAPAARPAAATAAPQPAPKRAWGPPPMPR